MAAGLPAAAEGASARPDGRLLSGWWRRFGAYVIDSIIVLVVAAALAWPWSGAWFSAYGDYMSQAIDAAQRTGSTSTPPVPETLLRIPWQWALISLLVYAVYEVTLTVWRGRTVGKMATGISVRAWDEARTPTVSEAMIRFLVKGIAAVLYPIPLLGSMASLFTLADGIWPVGDKQKQALHDKAPHTVVVVGPVRRAAPAADPGTPPGPPQA